MNSGSLRLGEAERSQLRLGAAALGVELAASMVSKLGNFADLLDLWGARMNLISCRGAQELVERHLLDSIAVEPLLPDAGTIVDLGSGAGLPGIPLAVLKPERKLILVEVRRRRANFLREVRRTLHLENVEVHERRAEDPPPEARHGALAVVSRAVWSDDAILTAAASWLDLEGRLFWMRTETFPEPQNAEPLRRERTVRYRIGEGRERVIEVFRAGPRLFHVEHS